jgi:hypothetical protein
MAIGFWSGSYYGGKTPVPGRPNEWEGPNFSSALSVMWSRECGPRRTNIQWLFQTNNYSSPVDKWNSAPAYYPGPEWVDWLGMSVYGQQFNDEPWSNFLPLIEWPYQEMSAIDPNKPIMVAEWAAGEFRGGGNKAKWIEEAFEIMRTKLPRVKAAVLARTLAKRRPDLQQSPHQFFAGIARAYRKGVADPYWLGNLILSPQTVPR